MAILGIASRIRRVDALIEALRHLGGAVVRVGLVDDPSINAPAGRSTGWYIAPQVVVLPGFVFSEIPSGQLGGRVRVQGGQGSDWSVIATEAPEILGEGLLGHGLKQAAIAILHLATSSPERVLDLCFDVPTEGDPVCLIHFPRGWPEACASFGQVRSVEENLVTYDADTEPGSSGAPVLDSSWRVLGMHVGTDFSQKANYGLSRSALLNALQACQWWPEIAAHHKLANTAAAQAVLQASIPDPQPPGPDTILVRAAISASLDRKSLSARERAALRDMVIDPEAARWTLRPTERRRVIATVGTIEALKQHRRRTRPRKDIEPLQQVLDRILDGPPYDFDTVSEEELGWFIQAARWFEPVTSELPKPGEIARKLERRRVRSRLERIAGPEFQGREKDLDVLREWYRGGRGPIVLTGIGGIGKSALVARFASKLPGETLLLWLDFDRPDLAPDDAVSVLAALADQAAVQVDGLEKPKLDESSWQDEARRLGMRLAQAVTTVHPTLLVLDSFEAAQYAERYQELWPLLEELCLGLPDLRVCVTGRAGVPGLKLCGKAAEARDLKGLESDDVRAWLQAKGVVDPAIVDQIVEIARGIPLVLRLAFRLLEIGGKVEELPRDLPEHLIAGYLYDRILDRVQNPEFKPLATGLLVLRRLSIDMLSPILGGLVPFPPGEPSTWFAELSREVGLVAGGNVLVPRAEVRSASLWLLECDLPDLVRTVDQRAAAWYAAEGAEAPEDAAELVYHRLRLGDIGGAEQAWRDECGSFLTYAGDDIRDAAALSWLQQRLGGAPGAVPSQLAWEQDAAERIRAVRGRKLDRVASEILRERSERSNASPLLFHDAYELHATGESAKARELLDAAGDAPGPIGRNRAALRALLAAEANDRRTVDPLLAKIEQPAHWSDRLTAEVDALAILAARISLTVDLDKEEALLARDEASLGQVRRVLAPADVASPRLKARLQAVTAFESTPDYLPITPDFDGTRLLQSIEQDRRITLPDEPAALRERRQQLLNQWSRSGAWSTPPLSLADFTLDDPADMVVPQLAELGWRRWWLIAHRPFLSPAYQLCTRKTATLSPLVPAIIGTLALFALSLGTVWLGGPEIRLVDALRESSLARGAIYIRKEVWPRLKRSLQTSVDAQQDWDRFIQTEQDQHLVFWGTDLLGFRTPDLAPQFIQPGAFVLHLFAPDPLRKLVEDLAGAVPSPRQT